MGGILICCVYFIGVSLIFTKTSSENSRATMVNPRSWFFFACAKKEVENNYIYTEKMQMSPKSILLLSGMFAIIKLSNFF